MILSRAPLHGDATPIEGFPVLPPCLRGACGVLFAVALLAPPDPCQDGGKKSKPPAAPAKSVEIVDGETGKALDAVLQGVDVADGGFCGVALVASKGRILLRKGYGIADAAAGKAMPADALYDWASVSKQFTAALVLRLIDFSKLDEAALKKAAPKKIQEFFRDKKWRKLSVDDPLSRFLPQAPADKKDVTLRQILNHTSGIGTVFKKEASFDLSKKEALIDAVLAVPMVTKPGVKWDYSNSNYSFVAALIEQLTGMTFEELCSELLWKPAGMKSSTMIGEPGLDLARVPKVLRGAGFADKPKEFSFAYGNRLTWGYRGCGGIVASTDDMLAWDRALRDGRILSKAALDDYYKPGLENYALGWRVKKVGGGIRVEHSGGVEGVVTWYTRHLDRDWMVALALTYTPKTDPGEVAERLARVVEKGE